MKVTALACAVLFSVVCFAASPTLGEPFNTENTAGDFHLENGAAFHLSAHSTGTIFADHAVLQEGAAHVTNFAGYQVKAGGLQIESDTPHTQAVIRIAPGSIEVASLGGSLKVSAAGGALLTTVSSGSRLAFQNTGATPLPASSGASPGKKPRSELKTWTWIIIGVSAAALAIGLTAAAQGKSPF